MSKPIPKDQRSVFSMLRASFLTGLVVVLPVGLTIYVVWGVIGWIDGWILPLIPMAYHPEALLHRFVGPDFNFPVRGVGVLVFLVFTAAVGGIARGLIGRTVIRRAENLVDRMPVVRSVYSGLKQITETFFAKSEKSFDKTCLVQFPRQGAWSVGFVASVAKGEISAKLPASHLPVGDEMVAVFVALTPLTSGLLIYVPASDIIFLDMKADEAVKLIVSAGLVYPVEKSTLLELVPQAAP